MVIAKLFQDGRHIKLVQCWYIARNKPEDCAVSGRFAEDIDTKAAAFVSDVREIQIVTIVQDVLLLGR